MSDEEDCILLFESFSDFGACDASWDARILALQVMSAFYVTTRQPFRWSVVDAASALRRLGGCRYSEKRIRKLEPQMMKLFIVLDDGLLVPNPQFFGVSGSHAVQ